MKPPVASFATFIKEHWSLLALIATGLVTWGITTADISQLKTDRDKAQLDHDILVEVRTEQRDIKTDIEEIKQTVRELARSERRMIREKEEDQKQHEENP